MCLLSQLIRDFCYVCIILLEFYVEPGFSFDNSSRSTFAFNNCPNPNDFPCRICNNICIPRVKWQDGQVDCPDGSDEECLEWQFDCKFGKPRCVSLYNFMDGTIDCASGFDEACPALYFVCADRSDCIDPKKYLDGFKDCADGSDEPCPSASFLCRDRSQCIAMEKFQNGQADCTDGSDEECTLFQMECACGHPRCIDIRRFNDSKVDCADSSDEPSSSLSKSGSCPDGSTPRPSISGKRHRALTAPSAPMVPCESADAKFCNQELNEMCMIVAGSPRCVCQTGMIRPPSFARCIPVPSGPVATVKPPVAHQTPAPLTSDWPIKIVMDADTPPIPNGAPPSAASLPLNRPPGGKPAFSFDADKPLTTTEESSQAILKVPLNRTLVGGTNLRCLPDQSPACPGEHETCRKIDKKLPQEAYYECQCDVGYIRYEVDGRCRRIQNECANSSLNDCDPNAVCIDNPASYECLCKEGYLDMSVRPQTEPGRHCVPLVNECNDPRTHDCDSSAECIDLPRGFTCRCKEGLSDFSPNPNKQPGRKCAKGKNECKLDNDCSPFAVCTDLSDGYQCRCKEGFVDASGSGKGGRSCKQIVNECANASLNDCDKNFGECVDTLDSYVCKCKRDYVDLDVLKPGRSCGQSFANNPCLDPSLNDCDSNAQCTSSGPGLFSCSCLAGFVDVSPGGKRNGRICKQLVDECALGTHRCDPNAQCTDSPESYTCKCADGWTDISPDRGKNPGRQCEKAENPCSSKNDCSPNAQCLDAGDGLASCQCRDGFYDASSTQNKAPGRLCKPLRDECAADRGADCSPNARCIDTPESFLCRCSDGFADESPDPVNRPGRKCVKKQSDIKIVAECDVNDPLACHKDLFEVCVFFNGTYRCLCPKDVSRLPDGRCKVINECLESRLNDCHKDAQCVDTADLYSCQCKPGFTDLSSDKINKPGRTCKELINECSDPKRYSVNCDQNAICVDTDSSFSCRCKSGFADISEQYGQLPGRKCIKAINECQNTTLHRCSPNAICEDAKESYICRCKDGFIDVSPNVTHYPGRVCSKPNHDLTSSNASSTAAPFSLDYCDPKQKSPCARHDEQCLLFQNDKYTCQCSKNASRYEDGSCKVLSACTDPETNDCDRNAICSNVFDSYECQCKPQYLDVSPDPKKKGRKCKELVNECADPSMNDCSPAASCIDTRESFACVCRNGYVDVSAQFSMAPGRKCQNTSNECTLRTLNTCDDNADCVDTPSGYTCQCAPGFVDVSTSASLPPGRVCTVQTYCPSQLTDLVFLVDGSGSIGSFVFKNEVLRFVRDFVGLFDIGPNQTRIGMIQFSDQIRHEFELGTYQVKEDVEKGVSQVSYLTGLTRTGAAIKDMVEKAFTERRGARPMSSGVRRVAIVITDGRSQDNVTDPALEARQNNILIFAIGVTDHVLETELSQIAGSRDRTFIVEQFTDLNTRLRSLIQKALCPPVTPKTPTKSPGCDPNDLDSCDRTRNEICKRANNGSVTVVFACGCPDEFERHPKTGVCGGDLCNFQLKTSCPDPEVCRKTFYGTFRCACPPGYFRLSPSGVCYSSSDVRPTVTAAPQFVCRIDDPKSCGKNEVCINLGGRLECQCQAGLVRQPITNECAVPGLCDPRNPTNCDSRRREVCLPDGSGNNICQCPPKFERHPVTRICLMNECATNTHDCDRKAICTDTAESYICQCPDGFIDDSKDPQKPGRICRLIAFSTDLCEQGKHNCSADAICIPIAGGFTCQCKPDYVDFSPNPQRSPGLVCKAKENECLNGKSNCHKDATCIDTDESYICVCKPGFIDKLGLTNPGRLCEQFNANERCTKGLNDCDPNARCIPQGANDFLCVCPAGYRDRSPDLQTKPGRLCIPLIPECDNPSLNDCDQNAHCFEQEDGFTCACKADFIDISRNSSKPGRICKKLIDECASKLDDCAKDADGGICEDTADGYACRCRPGFTDLSPDAVHRPGRICRAIRNKCNEGLHDCSPNSNCIETGDSFTCLCSPGYFDVSSDPVNRPGRSCLRLINECETPSLNDCSQNAYCNDTVQSYRCQCREGFVDESPDLLNKPGRICRPKLVNECKLNTSDCSVNADCVDLDDGFRCQCRRGFIDESPSKITLPGRICVATPPTTPKPECRIESINSCNVNLNEVCRMVNGEPKCVCPERFQRNPQTNACTVIDECKYFELNDCSQNANCVDELDGYSCTCRENFRDKSPSLTRPGRVCQPIVNDCQFPHLNDCHQNALCGNLENGFSCRCKEAFMDLSPDPVNRPGRICHKNINECEDQSLNSCDQNAKCIDEPFGYRCECNQGFLDISPTPSITGRACKRIVNECLNKKDNDCDPIARCIDTVDSYRCECPTNATDISPNPAFPGRVCHVDVDVCRENLHDCDKNAICRNKDSSFVCECGQGFIDRSPNPLRPGRVCIALVDECTERSATCSPNADCRDLEDGYTCTCKQGYVDRSPVKNQPGRVCTRPEICPSNHDCSSAAVCDPSDNGGYTCRCIPGYDDQSPNDKPGRVCIRGDKCRDARLNNCSQNAVCYSLTQGYRCECVEGFLDKSPNSALPGRVCDTITPTPLPNRNPCQDPSLNDCSLSGVCRSLNEQNYTCECRPGFVDKSQDPIRKPGRVCVPQPPVCFDSSQNDCHPFAICEQLDDVARRFTCRCRDGYVDTSPDPQRPGRICREKINECLDASKNDCAPQAICEDLDLGYKCRCPQKFKDTSIDPQKPGRQCGALINECQNLQMNNCSRFADCIDTENGYRCQCKEGYFDNDNNLPGRQCAFIINECEFPNLHDCDQHAECTDLPGGYSCRCPSPYVDASPDAQRSPGRICLLNECETATLNECHKDAVCQDTADSYVCHCKETFVDESPDPRKPGRVCQRAATRLPPSPTKSFQLDPDLLPCGPTQFCAIRLNERCVGGLRCECPPDTGRRAAGLPCVPVVGVPLPIRVIRRGSTPLSWASGAYGNPNDARYIEITDLFDRGIGTALNTTSVAPSFVSVTTDAITHPRLYNASWNDGLLFNFTVYVTPSAMEPKELYRQLVQSVRSNSYEIGRSDLFIDDYQIDPFAPPASPLPACGPDGKVCDASLNEVCVGGRVCACPPGKGRRDLKKPCVDVVGFTIPLLVMRRNHEMFVFNNSFLDVNGPFYKDLVDVFGRGCQQAYGKTPLWPGFINQEVRDIMDPRKLNGSWVHGCLFNFTVYFDRALTPGLDAKRCFHELLTSCQSTNYSLGGTELYLDPRFQVNPFSPCFKSDCHPRSVCIERGSNSYTCSCPSNFRDLDANKPGRKCIAEDEFDECANPSDNDCSPNADCIDLPHLYRCECKANFVDMSPAAGPKGRVCDVDFCLDVPFCPQNTSCVNVPEIQGARCQCHSGFMDIKPSSKRMRLYGENVFCLAPRDVNECELELTNCSSVASCQDLDDGYSCQCPAGYTDANPSLPGRVCAGASCGFCNGHGDCVPITGSREVKCRCHSWYTGEFCDKDMRVILVIIFAVIFLLLTLCCLLYFCLKCRCVKSSRVWGAAAGAKGQQQWGAWNTLQGSSSSESGAASLSGGKTGIDYYPPDLGQIPRAKLRQQRRQADKLASFLDTDSNTDSAMRIPRVRLGSVNGTMERDGAASVAAFSDGLPPPALLRRQRSAGNLSYADDSCSSSASSDYATREELERRVVTDVKKTLTTTTAQVHRDATAEFRVYPPTTARTSKSIYEAFSGGLKKLAGSSSNKKQSKSNGKSPSVMGQENMRDSKEIYESSGYPVPSEAIGSSHWDNDTETYAAFSQPRAVSEFTDKGELESISEESQFSGSSSDVHQGLYDKKALVKKARDFQPEKMGRGAERSRNETSSKAFKPGAKQY